MEPGFDLARLTQLEQQLGRGVPEIVATLLEELTAAVAGIEAAVAAGDLGATALSAHAARNSALMLDAQPMLDALRETEAASRAQDADRVHAGLARVRPAWVALRSGLDAERQRRR